MLRRLPVACLLACLLLCAAGCGFKNPYPSGSFERGAYFQENRRHLEATDALEAFLRRSPTDSLAAAAQLMKARSYLEMKEYPLAAVELRILCQDYPNSPLVEEATYLEGLAYLRQVRRTETDISGAHEAREHFLRFLRQYPGSTYQDRVQGHLQGISDLVVRKGLGAAQVFRRRGRPDAAAVVLEDLLLREPGSRLLDRVLLAQAETALKMKDPALARQALQRLVAEFPASGLAGRARDELERLPATEPAATDAQPPES